MSHTCHEMGRVVGENRIGHVIVQIRRAEACHNCEAKGVCQAFGGKTEDVNLTIPNTLDAHTGDEVVLALPEASVIKASAALYLLPTIGIVLGALVGGWEISSTHLDTDTTTLLGALTGLIIGGIGSRLFGKKMARDPQYQPTLVKVNHPHTE